MMKLTKFFYFLFITVIFVVLFACERPNRVEMLKYKRLITEDRHKKNSSFKFAQDSPVPDNQRWQFKALNYFPVDMEYKVKASFSPAEDKEELSIQTSSGRARDYVICGSFSFIINGNQLQLMAYQEKDWLENDGPKSLFVPFTDLTSGKYTYAEGRYLDLEYPVNNKSVIDFNLAYNPYCAYNPNFSCPIPPQENYLPVEIRAGEKTFELKNSL